MMNPERKAAWLTALRSGDYKQGNGRLLGIRDDGEQRFCCLGVACDLAAREGVVELIPSDETGSQWYRYTVDGETHEQGHVLPEPVVAWLGLGDGRDGKPNTNPDLPPDALPEKYRPQHITSLAEANDYGFTFDEIADLIEEHF